MLVDPLGHATTLTASLATATWGQVVLTCECGWAYALGGTTTPSRVLGAITEHLESLLPPPRGCVRSPHRP